MRSQEKILKDTYDAVPVVTLTVADTVLIIISAIS